MSQGLWSGTEDHNWIPDIIFCLFLVLKPENFVSENTQIPKEHEVVCSFLNYMVRSFDQTIDADYLS